jgi:hypothetical protein
LRFDIHEEEFQIELPSRGKDGEDNTKMASYVGSERVQYHLNVTVQRRYQMRVAGIQ